MNGSHSHYLAEELYKIGAIQFGQFTLKSGQMSPIYINLRPIISCPNLLRSIADMLWEKARSCQFDRVCGVPYTALPITTCLSLHHDLPMLMRRKEKKSYGTKQKIEGIFHEGQRCLIIEDVATTGGSILETAADIVESGLIVNDAVVLIDREQGGGANLKEKKYTLHAVCTLTDILNALMTSATVTKEDRKIITQLLEQTITHSIPPLSPQSKSFTERAAFCSNPIAKKLFALMEHKKSNLALSADVTSGKELLALADKIGPELCVLKTHIDIIEDFNARLVQDLQALSEKHHFLIFEDRKFSDIGHTVQQQYAKGVYHIAEWADMINAHALPGPHMIQGLSEARSSNKQSGLLLVAQMSSQDNLLSTEYTEKTVALAKQFSDFVMGFITQKKLSAEPQWIYMIPGVHVAQEGDHLGQHYITPEQAILENDCDIIIVGRGILKAQDPLAAAKHYRNAGWEAYQKKVSL